ncbi:hypothetical protein Hypma_014221 [Hypsizygus marmoreus]|uniref:Uncharacterized protein n=1 Tax=Hypsizygus marmoreus TaxID=39966 RepID=A0A369JCW7_HYPMA|nr:hypothetical protein Hypma_014221 [Hypsizygus marmoreus]
MALQALTEGVRLIAKPVHAAYFPYPIAPTIHAARISIAYQANARAANVGTNGKLSWPTYIAGYLVMAWGGTVITHTLLQLPPPMLYSAAPYVIYLSTHLALTLLFGVFSTLLSPPFLAFLDTILFPLDALVRVGAVTGTIAHLAPGSTWVNPVLTASPITHLIIGALASSGGGISASTLSTWSQNWSFSTPPILRAPTLVAFWWASMDVWGGALVAAVHGTMMGHEAFWSVRELIGGLGVERLFGIGKDGNGLALEPVDAKAFCAATLTFCFGLRVYKVHWAPALAKESTKTKSQ